MGADHHMILALHLEKNSPHLIDLMELTINTIVSIFAIRPKITYPMRTTTFQAYHSSSHLPKGLLQIPTAFSAFTNNSSMFNTPKKITKPVITDIRFERFVFIIQ